MTVSPFTFLISDLWNSRQTPFSWDHRMRRDFYYLGIFLLTLFLLIDWLIHLLDWCFRKYSRLFHLYNSDLHCGGPYPVKTLDHPQVATGHFHVRPERKSAWAGLELALTPLANTPLPLRFDLWSTEDPSLILLKYFGRWRCLNYLIGAVYTQSPLIVDRKLLERVKRSCICVWPFDLTCAESLNMLLFADDTFLSPLSLHGQHEITMYTLLCLGY